jgi:hypothetical protein
MFETKTLLVSSSSRKEGESGNNFTVNLETPIRGIVKAELLYASIPNTVYNIEGSNVIQINSNVFSIPPGFYGVTGIAFVLTQAIAPSGVICDYLATEGKFIFSSSSDFTLKILEKELGTIIGFDMSPYNAEGNYPSTPVGTLNGADVYPLYYGNSYYSGKYFVKSDKVANAIPIDIICLDIQELRNQNSWARPGNIMLSNTTTQGSAMQSFAVVPVNVISGSYITFRKGSDFDFCVEYPNQIAKLDRLTIRLTDINNNVLNFNQLDDNFFIIKFYTSKQNVRNLERPLF